jgi:hypothetical protein
VAAEHYRSMTGVVLSTDRVHQDRRKSNIMGFVIVLLIFGRMAGFQA